MTRGEHRSRALQNIGVEGPAVVSPVWVNRDIANDGIDGLSAETEEERLAKLTQSVEDRDVRRRLGQRGRSTVEETYSLTVNLPKFVAALREVADL